jgi:hypothetical protein
MCHLKTCESSDVDVKNECHVSTQGNIFKGHMCLMTHVREFFRKSHERLSSGFRVSGFLLFGFAGTPEARSCEATVEGFLLKLRRLQNFRDH